MTQQRRFKLPASLGGGIVTILGDAFADGRTDGHQSVPVQLVDDPDAVGRVSVLRRLLTEVQPEAPEEPPPGAYLIGDNVTIRFAHVSEGQTWRWDDLNDPDGWDAGDWRHLWAAIGGWGVTIVPLKPEVANEPVELPWGKHVGPKTTVVNATAKYSAAYPGFSVIDTIRVETTSCQMILSPEDARGKARALLTAADECDRMMAP